MLYTEHPELSISFEEDQAGVKFEVVVPPSMTDKDFSVSFLLYLDNEYPFEPPRVLCNTVFTYPSLADGRNLLSLIFPYAWTASCTLKTIVSKLPRLVFEVESISIHRVNVFTVGSFALGTLFDLTYWDDKAGMHAFPCLEINKETQEIFGRRALVITHVAVLQIESEQKGMGRLVKWASLNNLHSLKRAKSNQDLVTFQWTIDSQSFVQCFNIPLANECIKLIMENTSKVGITVDRQLPKSERIEEEEVSSKKVQSINISEIQRHISELENEFDELNNDGVKSLMSYYQNAIEYYSALESDEYKAYLEKLHKLFEKEELLRQ